MSQSKKRTVEQIVDEASGLPRDRQIEFLSQACASDPDLFKSALEHMQSRQHWPIGEEPRDWIGSNETAATGDLIGAYRVVRSLGQGGMGEVFLAERADDQFRQQVAIKLVRRGVASRNVEGRLRQERQILATLDHPNIARFFDGGTTKDGTPYIVMEYIDGIPIDVYCDTHRLNLVERLKLFITVCSAVQRAHRNLVVHRDIKPSNILVTPAGVPKLLDFGIAKLLDPNEAIHTMAVTQADVRIMTPDHASPEQILGDVITTSSDIYVLGVLLYELLCGYKPFVLKNNRLSELERAICEEDALTPSAAVAAAITASPQSLQQIAAERSLSIAKLRRELSGDLDTIVMKAMRKEPERRYSSVEQFAADVERYLGGMPIAARPDAWWYRTGKFVRRHAIVVGLSTVLLASLVGFSISTYIQSERIRRERDVANVERARAEEVAAFLSDSFTLADPARARGKEITAREILDAGAVRIGRELKNQPALQAELLDTIGGVYLGLGQFKEAEPLIQKGLEIRRELAPEGSAEVARSLLSLLRVYDQKGDLAKSEALARESLAMTRQFAGEESVETSRGICRLGVMLNKQGQLDTAADLFRRCLKELSALRGPKSELLTMPLENLARIARDRGDLAVAERLFSESLEIDRATKGEDHPAYIEHLANLAYVAAMRGKTEEADKMYRESLSLAERVLGPEHPETLAGNSQYAIFLMNTGKLSEAEQLFRHVLAADRKIHGDHHQAVGNDYEYLGRLEFRRRAFAEAENHFGEALKIYRVVYPPGHGSIASTLGILGRAQLEQHHAKAAEITLREAMDSARLQYGEQSRGYALSRAALGRALALQKRFAEAEPALVESYPIIVKTSQRGSLEMQNAVSQWIKEMYRDMGKPDAADPYLAKIGNDSAK